MTTKPDEVQEAKTAEASKEQIPVRAVTQDRPEVKKIATTKER
jgi:hypothetical protein